ncbi:cobalt-factor II C(20)-methyltransferase [Peptostreptococcaceae bacterium AGR-M142]
MSKFYGIGVGPGDSELITIKAANILKEIDILVTPQPKKDGKSLAHKIASPYLNENLEVKERHFPMNFNKEELETAWDNIANEIIMDVKSGKNVGFVTLGDPMVYSTYIYILKRMIGRIDITTIPGITSFNNIAADQNFPLVEDKEALVVVPCTMDEEKIDKILKENTNIVLMKVYKNFKNIIELIRKNNLMDSAILVSNSSKGDEKVYKNLEDLDEEKISYFSTILINKGWNK